MKTLRLALLSSVVVLPTTPPTGAQDAELERGVGPVPAGELQRENAPVSLSRAFDGGLAVATPRGYLLSGRGYRAEVDADGLHYAPVDYAQPPAPESLAPFLGLSLASLDVAGTRQPLSPSGPPVQPGGAFGEAVVTPFAGNDLVQLFYARPDGVAFEVWMSRRPAEPGPASLRFALTGRLELLAVETSAGAFEQVDLGGTSALSIGRALAIDATGAVTELSMSLAHGTLAIELPAELVANAAFPLRVDPLIGPQTTVSGSMATKDRAPDVVYDPLLGNFVVVWHRPTSATNADVFGARVSSAGVVTSGPFAIAAATDVLCELPSVAIDPNTGNYLVAYESEPLGQPRTTAWTLLDAADAVVASGAVVVAGFDEENTPDVGFVDGPAGQSGFVVASRRRVLSPASSTVRVTWIDAASAAVVDGQTLTPGATPVDDRPALPQYVALGPTLVAFQRFDTVSFDADVLAACVTLGSSLVTIGAPLNVSNDPSGADGVPDVSSPGSGPFQVVWEHVVSSIADRNVRGREVLADCSGTVGAAIDITSLGLLEFDAVAVQGSYGGPCDGQALTLLNATAAPAGTFAASVVGVRWNSGAGSVGLLETLAIGSTGVVTYSTPHAALDTSSTGFPRFLLVYDDDDATGSILPPGEVYSQLVTFDAIPITANIAPPATLECVGGSVTFTSTVTGSGSLGYQWRHNGLALPGQTGPTLTLSGLALSDAGNYDLEVSGVCGISPILSNTVTLDLEQAPTSVAIVGPNSDCPGAAVVLTASLQGGSGNFTYQWLKDGTPIPGATNPTYSIPSLQAGDVGLYKVAAINACGPTASVDHALTLTEPPTGAALSASASTVCVGDTVTFTASTATGTAPLDYEFFKDGTSLGAAGPSATLTIAAAAVLDGGDYTVLVTNPCGSSPSSAETLVVDEVITGVSIAASATAACVGDSVTLTASTITGAPQTYGWFKNGQFHSQTSGNTLVLQNVQPADAALYTVTVDNACGSVGATTPVTLTVSDAVTSVTVSGPSVLCDGQPATFVAAVQGGGGAPVALQWSLDGAPIAGATGASLSISAVTPADAGTYTVEASNPCGATTSPGQALQVDQVPAGVSVSGPGQGCEGGGATFDAVLTGGAGSLAYQWYKGGTPILGANGPSLNLATLQIGDAGSYRVDVSNPCGAVSSPDHVFTVGQGPTSVGVTGPTSACPTAAATFQADVTGGNLALTYQWLKDGAPIVGATAATHTIASVQPGDVGSYSVEVQSACGTVTSAGLPFSVLDPVAGVTIQATTTTSCVGGAVTLTASVATGSAPLTYQWLHDGTALAGATAAVLTLDPLQAGDAGDYTVEVSNPCATASSAPTTLELLDVPLLAALGVDAASVSLSWPWNASACTTVTEFQVLRATAPGGPYTVVGTLLETGLSCYAFLDDGSGVSPAAPPLPGTQYFYVIEALAGANVHPSKEVVATPTAGAASGDVNGDGRVDGRDLIAVALAMDSCQGEAFWNPSANTDPSGTCPPSTQVCGPPGDLQRIDQADADVVVAEFGSLIAAP